MVRYRTLDGRQRRYVLGRYPGLTLRDARKRARDIRTRARDGDDPAGEQKRQRSEARAQPIKTADDLKDTYFQACESGEWKPRGKKKRASTLGEEQRLWRQHIAPTLGDSRVEDVTPAAVKKLLRFIVAKGNGPTANRTRSLLHQVFNFAVSEGRVDHNPIERVLALGTETPRTRVLTEHELRTIWCALEDTSQLRRPAGHRKKAGARIYIGEARSIALRLLLLLSARRGEVAGMMRNELDLDQATWTIPGARTKNGRALVLPLPTQALDLVKAAFQLADERGEEPSPYLFPCSRDRSRPMAPASLSQAVQGIRDACAVADIRTHDFRRTVASYMVSERLAITPFIVGRILNHTGETGGASSVTHRHYAVHDYAREKRLALQAWANLLTAIVTGQPGMSNVTGMRGDVA
jgi:integrase